MKEAAPCAECGTTGGYGDPDQSRPRRRDGWPFGFASELCQRCYNRHYKRARVLADPARAAKPAAAKNAKEPKPFVVDPAEHQGLVWRAALKLQNHGIDLDDLVGWGQFGLLHACQNFDRGQNYRFSTYATTCIRGSILKAIAEKSRMIHVPSHLQTKENRGTFGAYQTLSEDDLGTSLHDLAVAERAADPLEEAEKAAQLEAMLGSLKPREAQILKLRFGIETEKLTLEEVGSHFGIHKERVRQVQNAALKTLRKQVGVAG